MSVARSLVLAALAFRGIDIVLDLWVRSPQLVPLVWALLLVVTAILLRSSPRIGAPMTLFIAFVSVVNAYGVLHPSDDFDLIVPFFQARRVVWLSEAALIVAAAIVAVGAGARSAPRDVDRTPARLRRPLVIGAACWAVAVAIIFWWPGTPWANYVLAPLIPIALALRFVLARRLGRADSILARVAGSIGVVCCLMTLLPIAYGLIIIYLLMSPVGASLFGLALIGTFALLTGAGQLRRSLRPAAAPDVVNATSPSS